MAKKKETRSFSIDSDVKAELRQRDDLNPSGAVNDFLKRLLRGENNDKAAKRIEIERKREQAQKKRQKAKTLEREAERIEKELEKQEKEKKQSIEDALGRIRVNELRSSNEPFVENDEEQLERIANHAGVAKEELEKRAIERYKNKRDDKSFQ